jgi:hypothetical protein
MKKGTRRKENTIWHGMNQIKNIDKTKNAIIEKYWFLKF